MTTVMHYMLAECLHEGHGITVHRARDSRDGSIVILKMPKPGRKTRSALARLRHEHELLHDLRLPGVIATRDFHEPEGVLVLESFDGETLGQCLRRGRLDLGAFLKIGIQLADTLGHLHSHHIIHKDINPKNILVGADLQIELIDFGIATRLPVEMQSVTHPRVIEGTLAYLSPEQTGRMNRAIDYRTDLYSAGVTFYAMLTGQVPFPTRDPMELLHCHIAKKPVAPAEVEPSIPEVVSDIVMKLLSKAAEERYKSAFGLKADLQECLRRLEQGGHIEPMPLGRHDVADRFQVPRRLYGRRVEIAQLQGAFEHAGRGEPELVLVSGYPGIGKSAVIQELHKSLIQHDGFFVSGKFDQLKLETPYSAVLSALGDLLQYLLAESEEAIAAWRREIQAAVGSAGQVLVDVLPDLELILGTQPPVPELPPAESLNRFRTLFSDFVRVFTRPPRSLVLFLDDLQWADSSTRDLLPSLLGDRHAGNFLVIGAYRDNEVDPSHPLLQTVADVEKAGCRLTRLWLGPLATDSVSELIADMFAVEQEQARPLAELVQKKTHGNPLFMGEFLMTLHKGRLVAFDVSRLRWTWDLAAIEDASITDNVVDLMAVRAMALSGRARDALTLAACIGGRFDLQALSIVLGRSAEQTAAALSEAVQEGLVIPLGETHRVVPGGEAADSQGRATYRFLHDRVQQAAYSLIADEQRGLVHLKIGRLLRERTPESGLDEAIFEIVNQLNIGMALIADPDEKRRVAELNRRAGKKAKAATAYKAAAGYLSAGMTLIDEQSWEQSYALAYDLHLQFAECRLMEGGFDEAERLCSMLLARARTKIDKASACRLLMLMPSSRTQSSQAIDTVLGCLSSFGIELSSHPEREETLAQLRALRETIGNRVEDLIDLPRMNDPEMEAAMRTLAAVLETVLHTNPNLLLLAVCHMLRISMSHGNTESSTIAYVYFGWALCQNLEEYEDAYRFGRLAYDLCEKHRLIVFKAAVCNIFASVLSIWTHHMDTNVEYCGIGIQAAREAGNLQYGCYHRLQLLIARLVRGDPLEEVYESSIPGLEFVKNANLLYLGDFFIGIQRLVQSLRGHTNAFSTFDGDGFEEASFEAHLARQGIPPVLLVYRIWKLQARFMSLDFEEGMTEAAEAKGLLWCGLSSAPTAEYHYYAALAAAARLDEASKDAQPSWRELLAESESKLRRWAEVCPDNYLGKHKLVSAEIARIEGRDADAAKLYDDAIRACRASRFVQNEGISHELAARFYLRREFLTVPGAYLREARSCYLRWGAHAKVAQLDAQYPELLRQAPPSAPQAHGGSAAVDTTITSSSVGGEFDIPSIIKASQALSGEIALDRLLSRLMTVAAENAGAERGMLILKREEGLWIEAELSTHGGLSVPPRPVPAEETAELPTAIVHYVVRTHNHVVLNDAAAEPAYAKDPYVARCKPKSVLCMPLVHQDDVKGVLYLENNLARGAFTAERTGLLNVLCSQIAISIENAYLYANLEKIVTEATRRLQEAQARVVKLEKEATELQMAGGFAHEMRNALTGAKMLLGQVFHDGGGAEPVSACVENSRRLRDAYLLTKPHLPADTRAGLAALLKQINGNEERVDAVLHDAGTALDRALASTNLILDYSRISKERPGALPVRVWMVVEAILGELRNDLAEQRISVENAIDPDCALPGKEAHFYAILKNLILNARNAIVEKDGAGDRVIRIAFALEEDRCTLTVADTGAGIAPEDRPRIFEPFFSTRPNTGTGLGLGVVRKLVSLYEGVVEVESEVDRGTTVTITLPPPEQAPP